MLSKILTASILLAFTTSIAQAQKEPDVKKLIAQLKDVDEVVRLKAAKELGRMKDKAKEAIPALVEATKDKDEDVRAVAKKSLAAIRESGGEKDLEKLRAKLEPIVKELKAKDNKTVLAAIEKLAEMGGDAKEAGADLIQFGAMSRSPKVMESALTALKKINPAIHKEIETLIIDDAQFNKIVAIIKLGKMGADAKSAMPAIKAYFLFLDSVQSANPTVEAKRNSDWLQVCLDNMVAIAPDDTFVQSIVIGIVSKGDVRQFNLFYKLQIDNKQKFKALSTGLTNTRNYRDLFINELAKLGSDAKGILPTLMKLRFDSNANVREAANKAIDAIKD